jgi:hypothetical protein
VAKLPARRDEPGLPTPRQGYAGFSMTGKDSQKWAEVRQKFLAKIQVLFEQLGEDQPAGAWLREQAKEFGALALDYAKAQLRKPGLDAAKVEAEVAKLYAEREKTLAEARKAHAEAHAKEIDNVVKELRLSLGMTKAMLIGEEGDEAILLGLQVEEMMAALKAIAGGEAKAGAG